VAVVTLEEEDTNAKVAKPNEAAAAVATTPSIQEEAFLAVPTERKSTDNANAAAAAVHQVHEAHDTMSPVEEDDTPTAPEQQAAEAPAAVLRTMVHRSPNVPRIHLRAAACLLAVPAFDSVATGAEAYPSASWPLPEQKQQQQPPSYS